MFSICFLERGGVVLTNCVRFSAVLLFVFAIAFFATACGGGDATYSSYFVPPAPSPTEPVPDPTPAYENPFKGANVGDMVNFGRYPQTAAGDVQDIEWRVLAVKNGRVLAISRYGLDAKRFDDDSNVWESSEIRGWLNGEFYNDSFNDDEKGIIASSDPGKVFLLSSWEADKYFSSYEDRKCAPTEYAKANGALEDNGGCWWWLRSPKPNRDKDVYYVCYGGFVGSYFVDYDFCSVRPALWINLEYENPFKGANVGDMVNFGRYPQTAAGDVQDIEWRVLAVKNGRVLAISRYGLDARRFDDDSNVWNSSEIRGWLNGEFYNSSFNNAEKGVIASSDPGKVFLLSKDEADGYFSSYEDRKCAPTGYARANGAREKDGGCWWWLRSPDPDSSSVCYVYYDGRIRYFGVDDSRGSARPALWINLSPDPAPDDPAPADENPFKGANVGDMVNFGRYPQTAAGDVQDIEWRVLAVKNGRVLAISRYGLDARRFDDDSNVWNSSEIRGWLNGEFYNSSFNNAEKGVIASSDPGKVFLLSKDEADGYFSSYEDRKCAPTGYARANGAREKDGGCWWWLRSPLPDDGKAVYYVYYYGGIRNFDAYDSRGSARPALWINL